MADNSFHLGVGEEVTARGTEQSTVGHLPLLNPGGIKYEPDDKDREVWAGQNVGLGITDTDRLSEKWSGSIDFNLHTEAGTVPKIVGTIFKHFFGSATSAQNATTSQYNHSLYPVVDPFSDDNLGDEVNALTILTAMNAGAVYTSYPYLGGRVNELTFEFATGAPNKVSAGVFGQKMGTITTNTETVVMPAANLRCDFSDTKFYTGTISRTGTEPDITDLVFTAADQFNPLKATVKFMNGFKDDLVINGTGYPGKTSAGRFTGTLSFDIRWADPASGFSSYDEFKAWVDAASTKNFAIEIDTGTKAGTGENHGILFDLPECQRKFDAMPVYAQDADPIITLNYEFHYNATAKYAFGMILKNSAATL